MPSRDTTRVTLLKGKADGAIPLSDEGKANMGFLRWSGSREKIENWGGTKKGPGREEGR